MALPANLRLRGHRAFDHLYRKGERFHGRWIVLRTKPADPALLRSTPAPPSQSSCRCAVVVSAKVSKRAVRRNRLRRLLHRWLTLRCGADGPACGAPDHPALWVVISLKPGSLEAGEEALLGECEMLFRKAGLSP
jgi:ribonuclease P protein component